MRFAIKTAPENTRWPDMLAMWRGADDIELFESAWSFDQPDSTATGPATAWRGGPPWPLWPRPPSASGWG